MAWCAAALLTLSISLPLKEGDAIPYECYTCQSKVDSPQCGDGSHYQNFLAKYCLVNQHYCLKLIETAGRTPMIYRKCTEHDCKQEIDLREGTVSYCSVCTSSLCNVASIITPIDPPLLYSLALAVCVYHLFKLNLFGYS